MALITIHSNRLEALIDRLAERLAASFEASDPFLAYELCIPHAALEHTLKLRLADRLGLCANIHFGFLAQWLWQRIQQAVPEVGARSPVAAETLQWRILAAFDDPAIVKLPRLGSYLARADGLMRFELAHELAITFERYATYRPHWLLSWAQGESQFAGHGVAAHPDLPWQAALWRHLACELGLTGEHPAHVFIQRLRDDAALRRRILPPCLVLFALPEIPPLYLDLLARLAAWMDIELYVLEPCREFWYDIVTPKAVLRHRSRGDTHATSGNALLADWGRATRASLSLLLDRLEPEAREELYVEPGSDSALHRLQQAILDLQHFIPPGEADGSIALHACHGVRRQVEVLHDLLLDLFQSDPRLTLDQVVVLSPQLEAFSGVIEAVFGAMPIERRLPYRIEGLPAHTIQTLWRALDRLLALALSRCEASQVLDFLAEPMIAQRFAFDESALAQLRDWVLQAGIHWGMAGEQGFRTGLSRLMLGHALVDDTVLIAGLLPVGTVAGERAELLARFSLAIDWLAQWLTVFGQEHPARDWPGLLDAWLDQLLPSAPDPALADQAASLRQQIAALAETWQQTACSVPLGAAVIRALLQQVGVRHARPQSVLTFAPLHALRGLPYRVVCLLGMDEGVFPSPTRAREFDLMAANPQPGDRQRNLEDRALFLDAVLAARDKLIILYHGRDLRDNAPLPPSLLVAQLQQALGAGEWLTSHPLQPFSRHYFDGTHPRLFSYASEYAAALNAAAHAIKPAEDHTASGEREDETENERPLQPRFWTGLNRPVVEPVTVTVTLAELQSFLRHPGRYWLRKLGIVLPECQEDVADCEPLLPEHAGQRWLREHLLQLFLRSSTDGVSMELTFEQALAHARASGRWPAGAVGALACQSIWQEIVALGKRLRSKLKEPLLPPQPFVLDLPSGQLSGSLNQLRQSGLLTYAPDKISSTNELMLWVEHLVLCAIEPEERVTRISHLLAPQYEARFAPLPADQAKQELDHLLALYRQAQRQPVPLFLRAARSYAATWVDQALQPKEVRHRKAIGAARQAWQGHQYSSWYEALDPWYALLTRGFADPLSQPWSDDESGNFVSLAVRVFGPLIAARQESEA